MKASQFEVVSRMNSALRRKVTLLAVILALSAGLETASAYAEFVGLKPIAISFFFPLPPKVMSQIEVYRVRVFWWNWNPRRSYDGRFLFIAKAINFNITSNDIKFTFGGLVISPQTSGVSLLYSLPKQKFVAGKTGTISVEIIYNRVGTYNWQIGIVQV